LGRRGWTGKKGRKRGEDPVFSSKNDFLYPLANWGEGTERGKVKEMNGREGRRKFVVGPSSPKETRQENRLEREEPAPNPHPTTSKKPSI